MQGTREIRGRVQGDMQRRNGAERRKNGGGGREAKSRVIAAFKLLSKVLKP